MSRASPARHSKRRPRHERLARCSKAEAPGQLFPLPRRCGQPGGPAPARRARRADSGETARARCRRGERPMIAGRMAAIVVFSSVTLLFVTATAVGQAAFDDDCATARAPRLVVARGRPVPVAGPANGPGDSGVGRTDSADVSVVRAEQLARAHSGDDHRGRRVRRSPPGARCVARNPRAVRYS